MKPVIEILAQIKAPHFTAGIVLWDDEVIEADPIVGYMKKGKWTRSVVRDYCERKGWKVSVIHQIERNDAYHLPKANRPRRPARKPG